MRGYEITGEDVAVMQMCKLHISGNVIPLNWFSYIKRENGKPHTTAIILLSDIVYWHRPVEIRNETTGELLGYRKKFIADKLQWSYKSFADLYGYTKDQVRDAIQFLANDIKVIILEFRHPVIKGKKFGNVLYIELNVKKLKELTYKDTLSDLNQIGYRDKTREGIVFKPDTNTDTTTETKYNTGAKNKNAPVAEILQPTIKETIEDNPDLFEEGENKEQASAQRARTQAALLRGAQAQADNGAVDLSWLQEYLRPLAQAFVDAAGENHEPIKADYSLWRKTLSTWFALKLVPQDITNAVQYMRDPDNALTIGGIQSVTKTARDRKGGQEEIISTLPKITSDTVF